jgi:ABC-type uncharacterized transport system permease subunit
MMLSRLPPELFAEVIPYLPLKDLIHAIGTISLMLTVLSLNVCLNLKAFVRHGDTPSWLLAFLFALSGVISYNII